MAPTRTEPFRLSMHRVRVSAGIPQATVLGVDDGLVGTRIRVHVENKLKVRNGVNFARNGGNANLRNRARGGGAGRRSLQRPPCARGAPRTFTVADTSPTSRQAYRHVAATPT